MKPSSIILVVKEISKQTLERNKLSQAIDKNRYYTLILAKEQILHFDLSQKAEKR